MEPLLTPAKTMMRYMMRYMAACLLAVFAVQALTAAPVDTRAARTIASRWMSSTQAGNMVKSHAVTWQVAHARPAASSAQAVTYYVLNANDGSAFVIVAGDDRACPVLAYGPRAIDMNCVPDGMQWLLDHLASQIDYLIAHPDARPRQVQQRQPSAAIAPLLTTQWNQRAPYQDQCPTVNGEPCLTGCVATAMAQVMNYWQYPQVLPPLPGYTTTTLSIKVPAVSHLSVEWNLMLDSYKSGSYAQEQGLAVAALMRHCGQVCKMDYDITNSGAFIQGQLEGFKQFGYNRQATCLSRDDYSDDEWNAMILEDLSAGRPVVYNGNSANASHNFVIDGYDGTMYHINWGWGGIQDGYFELDAMDGGGFKPSMFHHMLHGICPDEATATDYPFDFNKDSLYYAMTGNGQVALCRSEDKPYSGDIIVPDSVRFNGSTYAVTRVNDMAFFRCPDLRSVTLPGTLTAIGKSAFSYSGLERIAVPDDVTTVGAYAFSNCHSLAEVKLGTSLLSLSNGVLYNCGALTSLQIPASVAKIGVSALSCSGLKAIDIPSSVKEIGDSALAQCPALASVTVGAGTAAIGAAAFKGCASLTLADLPNSLTSLGAAAFEGCGRLHAIALNGRMQHIEANTFMGCTSLESITLPPSITRIGDNAFGGTAVTAVVVPDSVTAIGTGAWMNCKALAQLTIGASVASIGGKAFAGAPLDSVSCHGIRPPKASDDCFDNNVYQQASLTVPHIAQSLYKDSAPWNKFNSMSTHDDESGLIEDGDFTYRITSDSTACLVKYTGHGTTVTIPDHIQVDQGGSLAVTAIGEGAFMLSHEMQEVTVPPSVAVVGAGAFESCDALATVHLDEGVKVIGDYAFYSCQRLPAITFPSSVDSIGGQAFAYCTSLGAVEVPDRVQAMGAYVFNHCENLTSARVGTATRLPSGTFNSCYKLTEVELQASVRVIGESAFHDCHALTTFTCPDSLRSIESNAFGFALGLRECNLHGAITSIGSKAFSACMNLTHVELGDSIVTMGQEAFRYCIKLQSLVIGRGLKVISNSAFADCYKLQDVTIGLGVESIGEAAFKGDTEVATVKCHATTPPSLAYDSFDQQCYKATTVYVPMPSLSRYKQAANWSRFKRLKGVINCDVNGDGEVSLADVNAVINAILGGPTCESCDVNGDGELSVTDVNIIIGQLTGTPTA